MRAGLWLGVGAAIIGTSVLTGCGNSRLGPSDAIRTAKASRFASDWSFQHQYPTRPGARPCFFYSGGPSPLYYDARCATVVKPGPRNRAVVQFVITWGATSDPKRHTWELVISPHGTVLHTREFGDFGPWEMA